MHGLGNDFIIVMDEGEKLKELARYARQLCDRRFGIGADGLVFCSRGPGGYQMRIFNSDGSEAEMCGNAIRCVAHYLYSRHLVIGDLLISTKAGVKKITPVGPGSYQVNMGEPIWNSALIPVNCERNECLQQTINVEGTDYIIHAVSMGNPHCILFVSGTSRPDCVTTLGPLIENHPMFPQKTNVEFVKVESEHKLLVDVWERGAGRTLACGTGACASAVVAIRLGLCTSPVTVQLPGGQLVIEWAGEGPVFMTGPAVEVMTGKISREYRQSISSGVY
ncbi:MAG TPA: diaminopimelate epimerase [Firmicutes bacterium]|nr:diaminopimelate epimerase [Bacillota bacterium]